MSDPGFFFHLPDALLPLIFVTLAQEIHQILVTSQQGLA
jgi:hypothetical protein